MSRPPRSHSRSRVDAESGSWLRVMPRRSRLWASKSRRLPLVAVALNKSRLRVTASRSLLRRESRGSTY